MAISPLDEGNIAKHKIDLTDLEAKSQKVTVKLNQRGMGEVTIDGTPVNARAIKVDAGVGRLTTVSLDMILVDVDCEIEADVNFVQHKPLDSVREKEILSFIKDNSEMLCAVIAYASLKG